MNDALVADLRRELDKALGVLLEVGEYLTKHAEMNAALHCSSDRVMYSPLHAKVTSAIHGAHTTLDRTSATSGGPVTFAEPSTGTEAYIPLGTDTPEPIRADETGA